MGTCHSFCYSHFESPSIHAYGSMHGTGSEVLSGVLSSLGLLLLVSIIALCVGAFCWFRGNRCKVFFVISSTYSMYSLLTHYICLSVAIHWSLWARRPCMCKQLRMIYSLIAIIGFLKIEESTFVNYTPMLSCFVRPQLFLSIYHFWNVFRLLHAHLCHIHYPCTSAKALYPVPIPIPTSTKDGNFLPPSNSIPTSPRKKFSFLSANWNGNETGYKLKATPAVCVC